MSRHWTYALSEAISALQDKAGELVERDDPAARYAGHMLLERIDHLSSYYHNYSNESWRNNVREFQIDEVKQKIVAAEQALAKLKEELWKLES